MINYSQNTITATLFSIYYCSQFEDQYYVCIFQMSISFLFVIQIQWILLARKSIHIKNKIPNLLPNINHKAYASKSYILLSLLKKYLVQLVFLTFYNTPIVCCVLNFVIFFTFGMYILKFRFFQWRFLNLFKIF